LSVTVSEAARAAAAGGTKVTAMVQLAPALRLLPQVVVLPNAPGLAPVSAMLVMLRVALPGFDNVTVCAELVVPTVWLPKAMLAGLRLAEGVTATPVPVRLTL